MPITGENVYEAASMYGQAKSIMAAFFGSVIGLILLGIGIYFVTKKDSFDKDVIGVLDEATCTSFTITRNGKNETNYKCDLTISYTINSTKYTKQMVLDSSPNPYNKGNSIDLEYNSSNPNDFRLKEIKKSYLGSGSIVVAILIVVGVWLSFWLTRTNKTYAAATGALGFASDTSGVVNKIFRK
jgi:hypothetical protein